MRLRALTLLAALCALAVSALAQEVKYEKYTLPNGMTVILHEDHSLPVATVNIWYYVGSKDEPPRRSGFAHLFEHLMFMGTERVPTGQFDAIMEGGGGNNNASTSPDRTNYYDYAPSSLLPTLLWLEADRLQDFGRMMNQQKLDLQRDVVKNERRENYENAPYGKVSLAINKIMYPEGHPYQIDTIGLPEDLDAANVKDVQDFFATFYVPNNASMVVAGDFSPAEIKPLIAKLFGTLPRADDPIHRSAAQAKLDGIKRVTLTDKVPQARTYMMWHSPAYYKPGDAEMDLAAGVLSGGFASRLYQRLVVKDGIASEVFAYQQSQYLSSMFGIVATAKEGVSLDKLESTIDDELQKFLKSGPTAEEIQRQKAGTETRALSGLESLADKADKLNEFQFYVGEPNSFKWNLDRYRKATPGDVKAWAGKVLDLNARLILRVIPQIDKPAQDPRDQRPADLPQTQFDFPAPTQFTLSNGIKVSYWQRPELPLMSLSTLFSRGAASDPAEKSGLANATADMLSQGAGTLDAEAFSKQLDLLGASFGASVAQTYSTAGLSVLSSNFDKAMALYADAVIRPKLEGSDWEREKSIQRDQFAQDNEDPGLVARVVAQREFFGPQHPYGRRVAGSPDTVKAIGIEDIKREQPAIFRPDVATIFAAGSLSADDVKASLEKHLGTWRPAGSAAPQPTVAAPQPSGLRVVIVNKPDAVQTVIRFVLPGYAYSDPNRLALQGVATILGGTFTSRLNANLREAKGYTYGAGSSFTFEPSLGFFNASSAVRADVTGASLKEFLSEFNQIRTGDIKEDEALKARASIRTDMISGLNTLGGLVGTAELMYVNGRTLQDLAKDLQAISSMNAPGLNPVVKKGVDLEHGVLVLVGDKDEIMKQLAGLGLPQPEVVKGIGR